MKNKVIKFLNITESEYDDRILRMYFAWCQKRATSDNNLQELLANAKIDKWFFIQLHQFEKEFVEIMEHFPVKVKDPEYHYNGCVLEIFTKYPKPLLDAIAHPMDFNLKISDEIYAN